MARVVSGIAGFDELVGGGFIPNSTILVCGPPGSGKSNFALNFLFYGAAIGEKCMYLSLEESKDRVIENAQRVFGRMDWNAVLDKNLLVESVGHEVVRDLPRILKDLIRDSGVKRLVIDSVTVLRVLNKSETEYRESLFQIVELVHSLGCTTLMISEKSFSDRDKAEFTLEEFVADGVIIMYAIPKGELRYKALEVLKMRGIDHKTKLCPFKITDAGIIVYPVESVFWMEGEMTTDRKRK